MNSIVVSVLMRIVLICLVMACQGDAETNPDPPELFEVERYDRSQFGSIVLGAGGISHTTGDSEDFRETPKIGDDEKTRGTSELADRMSRVSIECRQIQASRVDFTDTELHCRLLDQEGERFELEPDRYRVTWSFAIDFELAASSLSISDRSDWDIRYTAESSLLVAGIYAAEKVDIRVSIEDTLLGQSFEITDLSRQLIGEDCDPNQDLIELSSPNAITVSGPLDLIGGTGARIRASARANIDAASTQVQFFAASLSVIRDRGSRSIAIVEAGAQYDSEAEGNLVFHDSLAVINNENGENYAFGSPFLLCEVNAEL